MANSKGFSSVIGTTFMVLVIMFLSTSVFMWTLSQNTIYNEAMKEKNQIEVDRLNEKVTASDVNYTVANNIVSVNVMLKNEGPVSVEIISLWVIDATINRYNFSDPLNINLKPGNITYLQGSKAINVTIVGSASLHQFSSWFVTARGNVVPSEREGGIIVAQVSAGIGSIAMDFASFIYYNVTKVGQSYILENYPNGAEGYSVPYGQDIAFEVYLTNFDERKRDIILYSNSLLWALFPVQTNQPFTTWWYIVNVSANGTIAASSFSPITLPYGSRTAVVFASFNDMSKSSFNPSSISNPIKSGQPGATNLILIGRIDNSTFGQNIPFVSIYEK
jgi:archaellum component FlaF (FlaF/FlaG flagellin family)